MNLGKVNIWGNSCRHIASRLAELDELHLSIQKVSGYTVEQLLQMFLAGCEMKRPEYPSIEEIEKARYSYMMHEMSLLQRAVSKWGKDAQMKMVLEEMSELQKEICKMWRGKDNRGAIAEEVADVEIMLDQLKLMLDIPYQVEQHRQNKLQRLRERLEEKV